MNKIAPSMMCCDLLKVGEQLENMKKCGVGYLHLDMMDGSFVPNFALGACFAEQLKRGSDIPLDVHMMTETPERFLSLFPVGEGDIVSVHVEATRHLQRVLAQIRATGAKAFAAINPATPVETLCEVLDDVDGVLVMTVNPGFAGQKMVPHSIEKIRRVREYLDANGRADAEIEVDGNVSIPNAIRMKEAGANIFVVGTAIQESKYIFSQEDLSRFAREVFAP